MVRKRRSNKEPRYFAIGKVNYNDYRFDGTIGQPKLGLRIGEKVKLKTLEECGYFTTSIVEVTDYWEVIEIYQHFYRMQCGRKIRCYTPWEVKNYMV